MSIRRGDFHSNNSWRAIMHTSLRNSKDSVEINICLSLDDVTAQVVMAYFFYLRGRQKVLWREFILFVICRWKIYSLRRR